MNSSLKDGLIPEEELYKQRTLHLAPIVDFLLIVLAIVALVITMRPLFYDNLSKEQKLTQGFEPKQKPVVLSRDAVKPGSSGLGYKASSQI